MDIGLLTFHSAINYGAVLQAFALQQKLEEMGYESEFINYNNEKIKQDDSIFCINKCSSLKGAVSMLVYAPLRFRKKLIFKHFRKSALKVSVEKYERSNLKNANEKYEKYIVGSDQVWNLDIVNGDTTYLLDFADKTKISYAASLGYAEIPEKYNEVYKKTLSSFSLISVREQQGVTALKDIVNKNVDVVLDPTLLLEKEKWEEFAKPYIIREPYILLYTMKNSETLFRFAEQLAEMTNCKIYYITDSYIKRVEGTRIYYLTPYQFVFLLKEARYIVTNSFHGVAFSINLNKNFFVEYHSEKNNTNSRISSLLNAMNLENRIIGKKTELGDIDWTDPNKKLQELRQYSAFFLKNAMNF